MPAGACGAGTPIVHAVRRDVTGDPGDAAHVAETVRMTVARPEMVGAVFVAGQATLVALLGTETG
jgi:hypothetical protein